MYSHLISFLMKNVLFRSCFVTFVLSSLIYWIYWFWSILPSHFIQSYLHLSWYPSQSWSILLPAHITVTAWLVFLTYLARNILVTPPIEGPDGLRSLTDSSAIILNHWQLPQPSHPSPPISNHQHHLHQDPPVPVLRDVPLELVNEFYFRNRLA